MSVKAEIEISASAARLPSGLRSVMKTVQGFVAQVTGLLSKTDKAVDPDKMSLGRGVAIGNIASNLAMRGLDIIVEQGKEMFNYQKELTRFGIAARQTPAQLAAIEAATRKTSSEMGVSAIDVLRAGRAYADLAGAQSFTIPKMDLLARAAQASGAKTTDLAGLMYQLTRSMKVADDQMEDTIGGLINQSKDGAIEAREMAGEFAGILPLFARFGVVGREGAIQAGAMFQVMRDGANSASEAGTMLQRVYAGIQTNAPRFEAAGVQVYEKFRDKLGRKVLLPFDVSFRNVIKSDLMKDNHNLKKAYGRTEGWRGMLLGDEASRTEFKNALGGANGSIESTLSRLDQLIAAGRENGVVQADSATYTESAAGRIEVAIEKIKNAFAEALTPERTDQIVAAIEHITESMGPLVDVASRVADAFGVVYGIGKSARKIWDGGNQYRPSDQELDTMRAGSDVGKYHSTPEQRAAAAGVRSKIDAYNKAIDDIMGSEKNDRPTDASIRKAWIDAQSDMGGGPNAIHTEEQKARGLAGRNYFVARDSEISEPRLKKIQGEISSESYGKQMQATLGPVIEKMGKMVSDAIDRARQPVVHVDGNPVAKAAGNATDSRRKP